MSVDEYEHLRESADSDDTPRDPLAALLPCEDPEEPCDADGRDEHRWCDNCIARAVIVREGLTLATPSSAPDVEGLDNAVAAVEYAASKLPPSGSRMSQAAENRMAEAVALLVAALKYDPNELLPSGLTREQYDEGDFA